MGSFVLRKMEGHVNFKKGPRVDFESGGGSKQKLHILGFGYIFCIQKVLLSEKSGGHGSPCPPLRGACHIDAI